MKKVVFAITGLTLGGAERVLVDLCNALCTTYDITILTLYHGGEFESQVKKEVHLRSIYPVARDQLSQMDQLKLSLQLQTKIGRKNIIKNAIKDDVDVVVSFLEGPMTWLCSEIEGKPKIAWVHNDIKEVFGTGFKAQQKARLNKNIYQKFDRLIFVSEDNLQKFKEFYPDNKVTKQVIYNYLDAQSVLEKAHDGQALELKEDMPSFIQVSRLTEQKALARFIEVHDKLWRDGYKHRVYIVGDGPLKEELQQKIKALNAEDHFVLLGKKSNPYPYINQATYFCLVSYYEGYGMVLDEAKILNKRILITDTAAREALKDYAQGLIVTNDKGGIYEGMKEFLMNPKTKGRKKQFQNQIILEQVTEMIGELYENFYSNRNI